MRRVIREEEPPKPSTRLSTLQKIDLTAVATYRRSEAAKLTSLVRGDLDWIVMKALEKNRNRRYDTANGLAIDIQRHLSNEPVLARPPSFTYKAGRFIRKHKAMVTASVAVLVTLITGLIVATVMYYREQEQHRIADEQRTEANIQRKLAEDRLAEVSAVQVLLGKHLRDTDPEGAFRWFSNAAESGNPMALTEQGLMLSKGTGISRDLKKALELFKAAAQRGEAPAALYLGEFYLSGKAGLRNERLGFSLIREAANAGYPQAMDSLGTCYSKGIGTKQDSAEAARLYTKASELGNLQALGNLAVLYINGTGVPKNPEKAFGLITTGAQKGHPGCMLLLARCVEGGIGTPKDLQQAPSLYRKAAEAGDPAAKDWCERHGVTYTHK
jgi:TPR repeat protein